MSTTKDKPEDTSEADQAAQEPPGEQIQQEFSSDSAGNESDAQEENQQKEEDEGVEGVEPEEFSSESENLVDERATTNFKSTSTKEEREQQEEQEEQEEESEASSHIISEEEVATSESSNPPIAILDTEKPVEKLHKVSPQKKIRAKC